LESEHTEEEEETDKRVEETVLEEGASGIYVANNNLDVVVVFI
jgi:hypothetical protein